MIDAIGSTLGTEEAATASAQSTLNQEDFIQLFLTELNFQDPLEPIDNREFLAQIAQFSGLEQARQTTESVNDLIVLNSTSQTVSLLGRTVDISSSVGFQSGEVIAVRYTQNGALLDVRPAGADSNTAPIPTRLSEIVSVR